jgi:hypothetical protein
MSESSLLHVHELAITYFFSLSLSLSLSLSSFGQTGESVPSLFASSEERMVSHTAKR